MAVEPGLSASIDLSVAEADTAIALGSGDVPVLATPRVVALAEQAAALAVGDHLDEGVTTVGMRVELDHLAPTPIGGQVTAAAVLEKVKGRRLVFAVTVNDERGLVAAGRITRVAVDRAQFLERAAP